MAIYHHIDSSNSDDYSVTGEPALPEDVDFIGGAWLNMRLPNPLVFDVDYPERERVPHFVGMSIPVFSDRLVETFRAAGVENFQIFPAVLRNRQSGEQWGGYWAFNAVGLIAAADLERSDADTIMGGDSGGVVAPLLSFRELVLDGKKTRNVAMFRLAESTDILLIHDRVLAYIKEHRPESGWGFEATEIETV